jgi:D-alanyl-D-alanine carboxypeptidase
MYTLYACLQINKLLNIAPEKIYIKVFDITTIGTLSMIKSGKYMKILDLYYAMMLPSGNDSASLLAFYYGNWLDK